MEEGGTGHLGGGGGGGTGVARQGVGGKVLCLSGTFLKDFQGTKLSAVQVQWRGVVRWTGVGKGEAG